MQRVWGVGVRELAGGGSLRKKGESSPVSVPEGTLVPQGRADRWGLEERVVEEGPPVTLAS